MYLVRPSLTAAHFPNAKTTKQWEGIREDRTIFEPRLGDQGKIDATTKRLTDYDADRIANRIFDLYLQINGMNREGT
jgi:hypothetical protein